MPKQRIPFAHPVTFRDSTRQKDARLVNGFVEQEQGGDLTWVKRPGTTSYQTVTAGQGRGVYSWNSNLYTIVGGTLYKNGVSLGSVNNGGTYYFTQTNDGTKLFFKNTSNAYYTDGTTITAISSVNYPATTTPGVAYLDGYFFVMDTKGQIFNSALEDPTTWTALGFLTAEMEPDGGTFLTKQLNYVMAMGPWSTEFFYDAANPAPGSPLGPVPNAYFKIGCASSASVVQFENTVIWVAQSTLKGRSVEIMIGYKPQTISNAYIERILNADNLANVYAFAVKTAGHNFYVLTLKTSGVSLVFDLHSKVWYEWTSYNGSSENYFNGVLYVSHGGYDLILGESDGILYSMDVSTYRDNGQSIYCRSRLPIWDAGTNTRKFVSTLDVISDKITTTLQLRYSDDDYQSWSSYLTVDLSKARSYVYRLGRPRRRAFEMLHTDNTPFRATALELEFSISEEG